MIGPYEPNNVYHADALEFLQALPDASVDAIITDPPYPEIERDYGRLAVPEWEALMYECVRQFRRIAKPTGSAMIVIQPNNTRVGQMRLWPWKFVAWAGEYWNLLQDVYWWNFTAVPSGGGIHRRNGFMRKSVKWCVWLGAPGCYKNQDEVLWSMSEGLRAVNLEDRALRYFPSGQSLRRGRILQTALQCGGVTPFNLLPFANANSTDSAGSHGHGAGCDS